MAARATSTGGEPLSFEEFVGRRGGRLLELAWLVTRHPEDARDAVQDALVSLHRRWSQLPTGDEFEAYLYRTVVNACLRVIRRRPRTLAVAEPDRLRSAPTADDPGVAVAAADEVWRLCGVLPAQQRAAVVLRFHHDLSFAQIADVLGCREATARSHIHRALATLRAQLERNRE